MYKILIVLSISYILSAIFVNPNSGYSVKEIEKDSFGLSSEDVLKTDISSAEELFVRKESKKYLGDVGKKWKLREKFNQRQINCFLDLEKCGEGMEIIKQTLLSALRDGCETCNDINKRIAGEALLVLLSRQPEVWRKMMDNYHIENNYGNIQHSLEDWIHK